MWRRLRRARSSEREPEGQGNAQRLVQVSHRSVRWLGEQDIVAERGEKRRPAPVGMTVGGGCWQLLLVVGVVGFSVFVGAG